MAGFGDHDRVYYEICHILRLQEFGDDLDNRRRGQHPSLHRRDLEIVEHRIDLRRDA